MIRVGIGYDVHRLVPGRKLVLGGVEIPFDRGLDGHSDADVLSHAIADALLGAMGEGDIGHHFPDTDEGIRGISSMEILRFVRTLLAEKNARATNVDVTMVAEAPKLQPHIEQMRAKIGTALGCDASRVNIKATTNEGLGTIGRGEGMACIATAIVEDL
jgi:2-C-methyl-D-erythritol 2,4-cyclodiphosphate synthase